MSFKLITRQFQKEKVPENRAIDTFIITEEYTLFKQGIENGNIDDVRKAIDNGVDVNLLIGNASIDNVQHAIYIVCLKGNWEILELLLKCPSLEYDFQKIDSLLCVVAKNLTKDTINESKSNFRACFKLLIDYPKIDINLTDYLGNTPLHYTVKHKCDELTILLLQRGAYIGVKNLKKQLPIDGIDYQILHDFFDSRMNSNYACNNRICNDFEINLDYSFLIKRPNRNNIFSQNTDQFYPIEFISQSDHLKELILHPLMRYLIWMKSEALSLLFIWNLILTLVFLLTIVYITFFNMGEDTFFQEEYKFVYKLTKFATCFCIFVISISLLIQTPIVIQDYKCTSYWIWRYLNECCILVLLLVIMFSYTNASSIIPPKDLNKQATAICILLIAIDMNLLMITIPKFQKISIHFLMLQKISSQFLSVLLFYLIILFAFALAFYVLDDAIVHGSNEGILKNFNNLGERFIRVIGMMIGELNLQFDSLLIVYYILTLLFIFLITIVLINLLNGLAVSDVSEIQLTAKLIYLIYRVQLIVGYEKYFLRHVYMRKIIFGLLRYQNTLCCINRLKINFNQYIKDVKIYPNRDKTMVNNISRPAAPDENEITEWNHVSINIVNQLIEHFKKKLEDSNKVTREDQMQTTLNEINEKLNMLQPHQALTTPYYLNKQNSSLVNKMPTKKLFL